MDLSAPISYNGLTISPAVVSATGAPRSGYEFNHVRTSVDIDGYLDGRANENGVDASDVFLRARMITIDAAVYGSTKGDLWDKQAALLSAFNPVIAYDADTAALGFLPLDFRWPTADTTTYPAGYIPQRYYVRPAAEPAYSVSKLQVAASRGLSLPVRLSLIAKDPMRYAQTAISISLATSSVVTGTVTNNTQTNSLVYAGSFGTWPVFTLTNISPYDRPFRMSGSIRLDGHTYSVGSLLGGAPIWDQGDSITVDTSTRECYWQDGTDASSVLTVTGGWGSRITAGTYSVIGTSGVLFDPDWATDPGYVDDSERTYPVGRLTLLYRQAYA